MNSEDKKAALKNAAIFKRKHLWRCLFFIKLLGYWRSPSLQGDAGVDVFLQVLRKSPKELSCRIFSSDFFWTKKVNNLVLLLQYFLYASLYPVLIKLISYHFPANIYLFKVNNRSTRKTCDRMTSVTSFWCFYWQLWIYFTPFSCVSIVDFEKVNASWIISLYTLWEHPKARGFCNVSGGYRKRSMALNGWCRVLKELVSKQCFFSIE